MTSAVVPAHTSSLHTRPRLVLFDAGGVLVTPPFLMHQAMAGGGLTLDDVRRAFFTAYTATTMHHEHQHDDFWSNYADALGLTENPFAYSPHNRDELLQWNNSTDSAAEVLTAVKDQGIAVAVVSNAAGDVAELLLQAGVCHVGDNGVGARIDMIFDSGDTARYPDERLSRKPATTMLDDAMAMFGVSPEEVLFVGDALWGDGVAAHRAGVPFLHMDPFGDCEETTFRDGDLVLSPQDHGHVTCLRDVLSYVSGERPLPSVPRGELS